jgi:glycosyltransferase involved in cell wall biosynthesis
MQTVFVNGRFLTQTVTGVQRYCHELLRRIDELVALPEFGAAVQFVCLAPPEPFPDPGWNCIRLQRLGARRGNVWEQLDLAAHVRGGLLFSPGGIGPWTCDNQILTLHDASVFAVSQVYTPAFRLKHTLIMRRLVRRARRILTVSEFSRAELAHYLRAPAARFQVIPHGADHLDRVRADESLLHERGLVKDGYLLVVASLSGQKNIQSVLDAARLSGHAPRIVIAGNPANRRVFRARGLQRVDGNTLILGYLQDSALKALYENALGLVFPSTYEGFGLPVLEAMRCGCPVLASGAASLPEVAGAAARYFDPLEPRSSAAAIRALIENPGLRDDLRRRGTERAAQFTWEQAARRTLEAILSAGSG